MTAEEIDCAVLAELTEGRADEADWQMHLFLLRQHKLGIDLAKDAAIFLARARCCAYSQALVGAKGWFEQARRTALSGDLDLGELFLVEQLKADLSAKPQVVNGCFSPDPTALRDFADTCWVRCGRCQTPGVVRSFTAWGRSGYPEIKFSCLSCSYSADSLGLRFGEVGLRGNERCKACGTWATVSQTVVLKGSAITEATIRCSNCSETVKIPVRVEARRGGRPRDPYLGLDLLLATETSQGILFAYNLDHLAQLRCYVEARVRDERRNTSHSWSARLPTWIKTAKNRDKVLRALRKLDSIASSFSPE